MSSSVHFKFKSQKEPSRVTFDGTGISVFELKREIINQSRLGDGSDFELSIYNEDTGEGKFYFIELVDNVCLLVWQARPSLPKLLELRMPYWLFIYFSEYDDDTTIIPRSTSVTARRLPAARPGKGGAARYVSGKMPVNARSAPRSEQLVPNRATPGASHTVSSSVL